MDSVSPPHRSTGYESVADKFISARSGVGAAVVREWARGVPANGAVLDLGCGHGVPITQVLIDAGLAVHGIDASSSLLAELQRRFPTVVTTCGAVEESDFFGRAFDGVVAWGLLFLLPPDVQTLLVQKVARALKPGGKFLFTVPLPACEWADALTGQKSVSLGAEAYRAMLAAAGLSVVGEQHDEGDNHYYFAARPL